MKRDLSTPVVVLVFGHNCAGKSTVGKALAGRFRKGAFIEVDELRYKVVGGLVAYSGGVHPKEAPDEYKAQCWMGVENAVVLARNFAAHGFSAVIEGLEDGCRPGTGWAGLPFGSMPVFHVALICDESNLLKRITERGWGDGVSLSAGFKRDHAWYHSHQDLFDCTVRTDENSPEAAAERLYSFVTSHVRS